MRQGDLWAEEWGYRRDLLLPGNTDAFLNTRFGMNGKKQETISATRNDRASVRRRIGLSRCMIVVLESDVSLQFPTVPHVVCEVTDLHAGIVKA